MIYTITSDLHINPTLPTYESKHHQGKSYSRNSLLNAITAFNKLCPQKGGLLNKTHIQQIEPYTHIVHRLFINNDNQLCADIELIDKTIDVEKAILKPLIVTPCVFGCINKLDIIKNIIAIQLEIQ